MLKETTTKFDVLLRILKRRGKSKCCGKSKYRCERKMLSRAFPWVVLLLCIVPSSASFAYKASSHQQLTFSAARHLNACASQLDIPALTPLQVRYIAKANVKQASPGFFKSLVRWNYYEREAQVERTVAGIVNTRMHDEFNDVLGEMSEQKDLSKKYSRLGRIVSYIQDMTSPAHVVPIFYTRFWRFNVNDRFNGYSIDPEDLERLLPDMCALLKESASYNLVELLKSTADETLDAVQAPIDGLPASWQAFWELDKKAEDWGEYGIAGNNFGRKVDFKCGDQKCILLNDDPLYRDFATRRQLQAIKSTLLAMYWMQRSLSQPLLDTATSQSDSRVIP